MIIPEGILCSKTGEWVVEQNGIALVGLCDKTVEKMGDIVFVELPEVGLEYSKDEAFATIESTATASEVYMPVSGKIKEINEALINSPELINENAFDSWFIKIEPENFREDSDELMEYDDYTELMDT